MNATQAPEEVVLAEAKAKGAAGPPHRILVVDQDNDLRLQYAFVLTRPGYLVNLAEDGAAGWEALQAHPYSLLITEHDLPRLTGVELVRKLRAARMALPVVLAAGRLPAPEVIRNPALQLAATLVKPFPVDELLNAVKRLLCAANRSGGPSRGLPDRRMPGETPHG